MKENYLQIYEESGWLRHEHQIFKKHLEAKPDEEVGEGSADDVFEAAVVVLAHIGLLE